MLRINLHDGGQAGRGCVAQQFTGLWSESVPVFFLQAIRIILAYRDKLVSKSCCLVKWLGSDDPDPVVVTTPSCLAPVVFARPPFNSLLAFLHATAFNPP